MNDPVASDELQRFLCPKCGKEMTHGYIAGKGLLIWTEKEKPKVIFSAANLKKKIDWWSVPTLESMKCEICKIGIFRYDY